MTAIRTPMRPITTGHTGIPGTPTTMDITGPIRSFHLSASDTGTTGIMRRHPPHHILEKGDIGRASHNDLLLLLFSAAKELSFPRIRPRGDAFDLERRT